MFFFSPLFKKVLDETKTHQVKTDHLLRVDDHDFTMRPAFAGKIYVCVCVCLTGMIHDSCIYCQFILIVDSFFICIFFSFYCTRTSNLLNEYSHFTFDPTIGYLHILILHKVILCQNSSCEYFGAYSSFSHFSTAILAHSSRRAQCQFI